MVLCSQHLERKRVHYALSRVFISTLALHFDLGLLLYEHILALERLVDPLLLEHLDLVVDGVALAFLGLVFEVQVLVDSMPL